MAVNLELFDIVPTHLAVQAMRDNGYKNAAYALAELMDNAIQARASQVEVLCGEEDVPLRQRTRRRIRQVAVLDNGSGMDARVLRIALQFGNGTYLDDRSGMGRFGMGLPSASISQCKRVDVWSWQAGPESALHSYIDLDLIREGEQTEVPEPTRSEIPDLWRMVGRAFGKSGTLVVWSKLDRCTWKTASTILRNSEFVVGRMYRRFLHDGRVSIRMVSFLEDSPQKSLEEQFAVANDPLYLMVPSSTPAPFDDEQMFQPYGEEWEATVGVTDHNGREHEVVIRFTYAREKARQGHNPGERPYGKHAAKNVGISLMRAGRELELSQAWVIQYDPVERWWGIEVDFPPALDELFGVANNKQTARNFVDVAKFDFEALLGDGQTVTQLREELLEEGDPQAPLLEISHRIETNLRVIRKLLRAQTKATRPRKRHGKESAEVRATAATKERKEEGHAGESDKDETLPANERRKAIEDELIEEGIPKQQAEELAISTIDDGLKYVITEAELETPAFFSVKPKGGALVVTLSVSHPAYKHLVEVLENVDPEAPADELRERLDNALEGLKLLLTAWARYEDEQPNERRRAQVQDARSDWGRVARQFLYRDE